MLWSFVELNLRVLNHGIFCCRYNYFGAANPWFVALHQAEAAAAAEAMTSPTSPQDGPAFPKTREAVEGRPTGVTLFQARDALKKSQDGSVERDGTGSSKNKPKV